MLLLPLGEKKKRVVAPPCVCLGDFPFILHFDCHLTDTRVAGLIVCINLKCLGFFYHNSSQNCFTFLSRENARRNSNVAILQMSKDLSSHDNHYHVFHEH